MIEFKSGDLLHEDVEALVNTVNCVGVMGRGIALQFKKAFPANFKAYAAASARKRQFSEHQIRVALQALRSESWLPADGVF